MKSSELNDAWKSYTTAKGISNDKRTKEFKIFKKHFSKGEDETNESTSEGLGDTIEKITEATGIKRLVEFFNDGEPCEACEKRKHKWNTLFRYKKPKELTEEEFYTLYDFFSNYTNKVTEAQQRMLLVIYNRVFSANKKFSRCSPCVRGMIQELEKIYSEY